MTVPREFRAEGKLGETQGPLHHTVQGPGRTVQGQSFRPKPLKGMVAERTSDEQRFWLFLKSRRAHLCRLDFYFNGAPKCYADILKKDSPCRNSW